MTKSKKNRCSTRLSIPCLNKSFFSVVFVPFNAGRRCCQKIRGLTVTAGEKGLYLFGAVCGTKLLQNGASAPVWCCALHPSPFIILHMGDIGRNQCGLLQLHLLCEPTGNGVCLCACVRACVSALTAHQGCQKIWVERMIAGLCTCLSCSQAQHHTA